MRTTLDLPDPIFRRLKAESALRGLKLKELVAELIRNGLKQQSSEGTPVRRSALPAFRPATGVVHPARSNQELEALLDHEEVHDRA